MDLGLALLPHGDSAQADIVIAGLAGNFDLLHRIDPGGCEISQGKLSRHLISPPVVTEYRGTGDMTNIPVLLSQFYIGNVLSVHYQNFMESSISCMNWPSDFSLRHNIQIETSIFR